MEVLSEKEMGEKGTYEGIQTKNREESVSLSIIDNLPSTTSWGKLEKPSKCFWLCSNTWSLIEEDALICPICRAYTNFLSSTFWYFVWDEGPLHHKGRLYLFWGSFGFDGESGDAFEELFLEAPRQRGVGEGTAPVWEDFEKVVVFS